MSIVGNHGLNVFVKHKRLFRVGVALFSAILFLSVTIAHACGSDAHNVSGALAYYTSAHNHSAPPRNAKEDVCRFVRDRIVSWEASTTGLDLVAKVSQAAVSTGIDLQVIDPWSVPVPFVRTARPLIHPLKQPLFIVHLVVRI